MLSSVEQEFLLHSNLIEDEVPDAFADACAAWAFVRDQEKLTVPVLLECHRLLMQTRNLDPRDKGVFTRHQTWVAGRCNPHPRKVPELIDEWIEDLNLVAEQTYLAENSTYKSLDKVTRNSHIRYEKIHPFVDGNGRTGRMFYNWLRLRLRLPIHVIRVEDREEYYSWFK